MLPPFLRFPSISRYDIEFSRKSPYTNIVDYLHDFHKYYANLSDCDKAKFEELFPLPYDYLGFYDECILMAQNKIEDAADTDRCFYESFNDFSIKLPKEKACKYKKEDFYDKELKADDFVFFWSHRNFKNNDNLGNFIFSQWYDASFVDEDRTEYINAEQFMMAKKALLFNDEKVYNLILLTEDPAEIKSLGRNIQNFDQKVWDKFKYPIVFNANYKKFHQNTALRKYLLDTENKIIVEASPADLVWGIGLDCNDKKALDPTKWLGLNLLGFALMHVRDELRETWRNESLFDDKD